ncbi:heavy metal-associated isoprenylated plant protein 3-like [Phaseolus vulgaris]|uniref:heavy metal-associated isoprenylated plant protein 3-like n=1 Tax=Phaseolus vulgaris TaxID=3885 RepID=UPI0035CAC0C0
MAQPSAKIRNFIKKIKREYAKVEIRLHSSFLYTLLDVKSLRLNCAQKQVKKSDYGHKNEKGSKNEEPPSSYPTTVVFKIDMHCDECASKIIKCLHAFREGVESLKPEIRTESVDSIKPKDKLSGKTKKNVDIASPVPDKDKENKPKNNEKKTKDNEKKTKDKEAPVTTTLLKVLNLCPCQGCSNRIRRAGLRK